MTKQQTMDRDELAAALRTCSPTMLKAVKGFALQAYARDLDCTGVSCATLVALQKRGLIKLYGFTDARDGDWSFTVSRCF